MDTNFSLPAHLVAIPDGNRRWAKARGLHPWDGHREGMKKFREVKSAVFEAGIPYFTFWGASYDNLTKRAKTEVKVLVSLFRQEVGHELKSKQYVKDEARVRILGEWREIIKDVKLAKMVDELEKDSARFSKRNFTLLLGYDGKREMLNAIQRIAKAPSAKHRVPIPTSKGVGTPKPTLTVGSPAGSVGEIKINYDDLKRELWTGELPPVDFVIRTGGEPHWSAGFMMWLTTDSQFYFTEKHWPAFGEKELKLALKEYEKRGRRFGK